MQTEAPDPPRRPASGGAIVNRLLGLTLAMTLLAGFVDAVGYVRLGQLYLSFMSGNTTRWGIALAAGNLAVVGWGGAIIVIFIAGSMLGTLIVAASGRFKLVAVLAAELACLSIALALVAAAVGRPALLTIALAMGMQNAAHQLIHGSDTGRTFITGTLVSVGHALAQSLLGKARWVEVATGSLSWLAFVCGVSLGAISVTNLGLGRALTVATVTLAALVLTAWHLRSESPGITA